jgi:hypothetical protein
MSKQRFSLAWVITGLALAALATHCLASVDGAEQSIAFQVLVPKEAKVGIDGYKTQRLLEDSPVKLVQ